MSDMVKKLCVTVLGSGYLPVAPGTWSSAVGVILYLPLYYGAQLYYGSAYYDFGYGVMNYILTGLIVIASIIGVAFGRWAIEYYRSKDPKSFVIDELAGMWISLLVMPVTKSVSMLAGILLTQFVLFRFFDIIKPTPARQSESLPGGVGIMADDIIAGIYANITGQILFRLIFR